MKDNKSFFGSFGFKKINPKEKVNLVKEVFDGVASKYNLMNDLMSMGVHRLWKSEFVNLINPSKSEILLDVGFGTGDIASLFLKRGGKKVFALDINESMLEVGKKRMQNEGYESSLEYFVANAEQLPFDDNKFPAYSIAFCIRNVTNIKTVLEEAYRVLKPGGKFYCLEFSNVDNFLLSKVYDMWSFHIIPKIGELITKKRDAYEYLVESIRCFPKQEEFKNLIIEAGFKDVAYKNLNSGIVAIHSAVK